MAIGDGLQRGQLVLISWFEYMSKALLQFKIIGDRTELSNLGHCGNFSVLTFKQGEESGLYRHSGQLDGVSGA